MGHEKPERLRRGVTRRDTGIVDRNPCLNPSVRNRMRSDASGWSRHATACEAKDPDLVRPCCAVWRQLLTLTQN